MDIKLISAVNMKLQLGDTIALSKGNKIELRKEQFV